MTSTRKHISLQLIEDARKKNKHRLGKNRWQRRDRKRLSKSFKKHVVHAALTDLNSGDFPDKRPIEAMGKLGLTDREMADVLGVTYYQFNQWVGRSPSLKAALLRGRRIADTHVANSVYMQAIGFAVPEEKIFYDSKRGKVVRAETEKYYPPNAIAAIFWLKNRYAEFWSDRRSDDTNQGNTVQQVKFVLVNAAQGKKGREEILDGDYQILDCEGIQQSND